MGLSKVVLFKHCPCKVVFTNETPKFGELAGKGRQSGYFELIDVL